jgi:hypothetical protein
VTPLATLASITAPTLAAITLCYAAMCWLKPFRSCRRCAGLGRRPRRIGKGWRPCRPCNGNGGRLRAGRWIFNQLTRLHSDGNR